VSDWFSGQYEAIPHHMRDSLLRWVLDGRLPGDFLQAVISNNLRDAVSRADAANLPLLGVYSQWFYNVAPWGCHGDRRVLTEWRGLNATV